MGKKYFFDFDGTLISVNSFPRWVFFIFLKSLAGFKFEIAYKIIQLTTKRKIVNSITHQQYKESLALLPITEEWNKIFFIKIYKKYQIKRTQELIESIKSSTIVLSSAAPYCYLKYIAAISRLDSSNKVIVIGSYDSEKKLSENYKHKKLENLLTLGLIEDKSFFDLCVTDSYDDIAVALKSKSTLLINPKKLDLKKFKIAINPDRLKIIRE